MKSTKVLVPSGVLGLGFDLKANFNFPLFAKNPVEFWKKWHISLTSWIRDYIYWPMALKTARKKSHYYQQYLINIYIWILTGLWHGANYTFLVWGFYWGIVLFIYSIIRDKFSQKNLIIGKNRMTTILNLYKTFFMFLPFMMFEIIQFGIIEFIFPA